MTLQGTVVGVDTEDVASKLHASHPSSTESSRQQDVAIGDSNFDFDFDSDSGSGLLAGRAGDMAFDELTTLQAGMSVYASIQRSRIVVCVESVIESAGENSG